MDRFADRLAEKIRSGRARLGVVGLGYVGLPLALAAARSGLEVLGFDIDEPKVEGLNRGRSPLAHIDREAIAAARASGGFAATADFARLREMDAIAICVPTPLGPHREPDLSFVEATSRQIARTLRAGQLVVLESTTWPGTTREVVKPILEATGLRSGGDFFLAYSPEREDPGNPRFTTARIPKLVGGDGETARDLAVALYGRFVERVVPVESCEIAEAAKLTENIFRAVNIALVNELKIVFTAMGIDVHRVIDAAATKPFGFMPFRPGPGLGGHCIPIDPFYLTWKAHEVGVRTRFIELAGEINRAMPRWVVERLAEAVDRRYGKGLSRARLLLLGVAYKKNVDDVRESPAFAIWELLEARGAEVAYHDPLVAAIPPTREHRALAGRRSLPLDAPTLAAFDAALVVTDHDAIDWELVAERAPLVVDTRDRLPRRNNVVPA
ncbi:MAG: nucleotide sugar dehydrogenase [Geminicoccaceae bacterium]|nr:nucleotide sugar dehydrogenase [Geminicoccaceae bacterium]MDW8341638.1 nucleotide sugar dehydrogenase [Geminicoccaceae bacterium]